MKANQIISYLTAGLVFLVALGSFALSYSALHGLANQNGITGWLSYIWPLLIDASLIVFSLAVVNSYLQSESTWKQWGLVGVYTLTTIGFNILHAPNDLQSRIVAAIAPISLFFSFEILMSQLKNSAKRSSVQESIVQLERRLEQGRSKIRSRFEQERSKLNAEIERIKQELNAHRSTVQTLDAEIEQKRSTIVQLSEEIEQLERSKKAAEIVQYDVLNARNEQRLNEKQQALNELLNIYRLNPNITQREAADKLNKSPGTISNYLNELEQAGLLHRNGNGVEVLQ